MALSPNPATPPPGHPAALPDPTHKSHHNALPVNWDAIKGLYLAGTSIAMIARSIVGDNQALVDRLVRTIAKRSFREGWKKSIAAAQTLQEDPSNYKEGKGFYANVAALSNKGVLGANIGHLVAERKQKYMGVTTEAVERAAELLGKAEFACLEDATLAFSNFEPIHKVAKDLFGIGQTGASASVNVQLNVMEAFSMDVPGPTTINATQP